MKSILSSLVLLCTFYQGFGQTDLMMPSFNLGYGHFNPAYFSPESKFSSTINRRTFPVFPRSQGYFRMLRADLNVYKNRFRSGIYAHSERMNWLSKVTALGWHNSYQLTLKENVILSLGARINYVGIHYGFGNNALADPDPNSVYFQHKSFRRPDFDFGTWLSTSNFNGGISVKHIFSPKLPADAAPYGRANTTIYDPHLYLIANYHLELSPKISIDPGAVYRRIFSTFRPSLSTVSIGAQVGYKDIFFCGCKLHIGRTPSSV